MSETPKPSRLNCDDDVHAFFPLATQCVCGEVSFEKSPPVAAPPGPNSRSVTSPSQDGTSPAVRWSEHGLRISGEDAASFLRALADPEGYPDRPTGVSDKLQRVAKWIEASSSELAALRVALETARRERTIYEDALHRITQSAGIVSVRFIARRALVDAKSPPASLGAGFPQETTVSRESE